MFISQKKLVLSEEFLHFKLIFGIDIYIHGMKRKTFVSANFKNNNTHVTLCKNTGTFYLYDFGTKSIVKSQPASESTKHFVLCYYFILRIGSYLVVLNEIIYVVFHSSRISWKKEEKNRLVKYIIIFLNTASTYIAYYSCSVYTKNKTAYFNIPLHMWIWF